jgi:membrane fusion protein (multidrug efflux system)
MLWQTVKTYRQPVPCLKSLHHAIRAFLLGLLLSATGPCVVAAAPAGQESAPPLVKVAPIITRDINLPMELIGHVEAIQEVALRARVSGVLEQVNFKEGSDVRAGDLLYLIEQAPYQARVDAAKAEVASAEATLVRTGRYLQRLRNAAAGSVPATDVESAEADDLQARAELEATKAALVLAELDLSYTRITAPLNGRIGATALSRGNLCGPESGPLAKIVQLTPIRVQYTISENDLATLLATRAAATADKASSPLQLQLRLPDGSLLDDFGRVDFVDNSVDRRTGTLAVRALFENRDGRLLPGQYVTVLIRARTGLLKPLVPQAAVLEDREGRYVFIVDDQGQVEQRRITTGATVEAAWVVESGLKADERVIIEGIQKVRPGQTVKAIMDGSLPKD